MTEQKPENKKIPVKQLKNIWQDKKNKQFSKKPTFVQKPIKKITGRGR